MTNFEVWSVSLSVIQLVAVIGGFTVAILQLSRMRKDAKIHIELPSRHRAMDLVARYNDPAFVQRRVDLRGDPVKQASVYEVAYLLNFFEEVAMSVKHRTANEVIVREYFSTVLRLWMEEEFIVQGLKEARQRDSQVFELAVGLYRTWYQDRQVRLRINEVPELN